MIKPIDFPERNSLFFVPELMARGVELPSFNDGHQVITCWHLDAAALQELQANGGKIYIRLVQHRSVLPIALYTIFPVATITLKP
ncbi:MAG: hypothetical protein ACO1OF_16300 [Adhaeribacter sp.]